ncbi:GNAT family N-acetyltransferase [Streptomyces cyaneogriseus]|uniref:GNAT family N-acetyltransferase n=1 Tax=Streptomyces cyaneogriseus TaxID=68192 RepID=UPI00069A6CB1|nr:GNAT family N-acetyltransferase [Streptomyces cyaneogriseus]
MHFRSLTASDVDRVLPLLRPGGVGAWADADTFRKGLARGEYRPEWTWMAEDGGEPCAVALWWGTPGADRPSVLNTLHVREAAGSRETRAALAAQLLTTAHTAFAASGQDTPPEYHVLLPADWRDHPETVAGLAWRQEASRRAGLTVPLERLRYEWTPENGTPRRSDRLRFRPEPDDEVFAHLFRRVLEGTLDVGSRTEAERAGAAAQARADLAFYRDSMQGDRSWWRIGETPRGEPVGFTLPSRNTTSHVVGYLGVLPRHRGHGYVDDLLAETTRLLSAEAGADLIRADTDLPNHPMAAAFARAGYRNFTHRLVLSAPWRHQDRHASGWASRAGPILVRST